jgi:hypothetical protein
VLDSFQGTKIETIPIREEPGIVTMAFAFKEVFDNFGPEVTEIAMDSTCKQLHTTRVIT